MSKLTKCVLKMTSRTKTMPEMVLWHRRKNTNHERMVTDMKKALKGILVTAMMAVMAVAMVGCGSGEDTLETIESTFREVTIKTANATERKNEIDSEKDSVSESEYYYRLAEWCDDTMHEYMEISTGGEESARIVDSLVDVFEVDRDYYIDLAMVCRGRTEEIKYEELREVFKKYEDRFNKSESNFKNAVKMTEMYGVDTDRIKKILKEIN